MNELTPSSQAARADASLRKLRDKRRAEQFKRYFKPNERVWIYGVDTPSLRALESRIYGAVGKHWTVNHACRFCDSLVRKKYLECKALGVMLLARYRKHFQRELLGMIKTWLTENLCDNWAAADTLAGQVLAPLVGRYPELIDELLSWTGSDNLWLRRSAAVGLVPIARKGTRLDAAYRVAESLFGDDEDLIHKASGWLLREAGKTDMERLRAFLLSRGARIPRTALRYAIERFPASEKNELLVQTKASR